jgi:hypothetical protein
MWPWLFGAILLISGLVIIAFHQYWRSPAAVIVSIVGWFLAVRGVLLLTVPRPTMRLAMPSIARVPLR